MLKRWEFYVGFVVGARMAKRTHEGEFHSHITYLWLGGCMIPAGMCLRFAGDGEPKQDRSTTEVEVVAGR